MRSTILCLWLAALAATSPAAAAGGGFEGHWDGWIKLPGISLDIRVHLSTGDNDEWTGTIDIPMQNASGLPLGGFVVEGNSITFVIEGVPGDPTFHGTLDGDTMKGPFTQSGQTLEFELSRGAEKRPGRPQDPVPPFPYTSEDVGFANGVIKIAGTLTVPDGDGPFPAVVLLTGSGAQNRDEELFNHRPFLVIADHLSRNGIAVLRCDDRGVGGTGGQMMSSTTEDFASDALAAVSFLKKRPKIAGERIGLIGHSEGAIAAAIAARKSSDVAFVVFMAGPGVSMKELLPLQVERLTRAEGLPENVVREQVEINRELIATATGDGTAEEIKARLATLIRRQNDLAPENTRPEGDELERAIAGQVNQLMTPWFQFLLRYDPRPDLKQITVPVLALNGELDLQVIYTQHLPVIEETLKAAGNDDVTTRSFPGLNHLFQHAKKGTLDEYGEIDETISPEVLDLITDWIRSRFASPAR